MGCRGWPARYDRARRSCELLLDDRVPAGDALLSRRRLWNVGYVSKISYLAELTYIVLQRHLLYRQL